MSSNPTSIGILVNVDLEPSSTVTGSGNPSTASLQTLARSRSTEQAEDPSLINSILEADSVIPSYQNQTAADIESGRARMDSVASYG